MWRCDSIRRTGLVRRALEVQGAGLCSCQTARGQPVSRLPEQPVELLDREACLANESAQGARFQFMVVGNGKRLRKASSAHDDVASPLAFHFKSGSLEGGDSLAAREDRKGWASGDDLGLHLHFTGLESQRQILFGSVFQTNADLLGYHVGRFNWSWEAFVLSNLQTEHDGFPDVRHSVLEGVALAHAPRDGGADHRIAALSLGREDDRELHDKLS